MANMSYVRFQNTLSDLMDCQDHINDSGLSKEEEDARTRLIALCKEITEEQFDCEEWN